MYYDWPIKRLTKRSRTDHYPNLRRRGIVDPKSPGLSRRSRLISMALLRSNRRWDTYADKVRIEELPWEESKKTLEWRSVIQNGRLVRGLMKLKENTKERRDRLARNDQDRDHTPYVSSLRVLDRRYDGE